MSRGEKETYPHIWSNGGAPANSPQSLPARLCPSSLWLGSCFALVNDSSAKRRCLRRSLGGGDAQGDPDNYSLGRGTLMQHPRKGKVVIAALRLISSAGSAAAGS